VSVLMRFAPAGTPEQYDEVIRRFGGDFPPDGLELHVCFLTEDGGFRVSEIWESQEHFNAWGERLVPVLTELGVDLPNEPEVFEVHNIIRR